MPANRRAKLAVGGVFLTLAAFPCCAIAQDCSQCPNLICGTSCFYTDPTTGLPAESSCGSDLFNVCQEPQSTLPCSSCPQCPAPNTQCLNGNSEGTCPSGPPAVCNPNGNPPPGTTLAPILQWHAQSPAIGHRIGHADASQTWTVNYPGPQDWLSYGPYITIPFAGDYVAAWHISNASTTNSRSGIGNLDVNDATTQTELASLLPLVQEAFGAPVFTLPFTIDSTRAGHQFEFRVFWFDSDTTTEDVLGYVPLQWNGANTQANPWHVVGQPIGTEWSASVGQGQNWFQYGPYVQLPVGTYIAMWTLRVDNNSANNDAVAIVDVNDATTQTRLQSLQVLRRSFRAPQAQQVFQLPFAVTSDRAGHKFEFRIWYTNVAWLREEAFGYAQVQ